MSNNSDKKGVDIITFIKTGNYKLEILNYDVPPLAIIYGFITALISAITIFIIKNMYPGLLIGFISGFLAIIIVKILFLIWDRTVNTSVKIRLIKKNPEIEREPIETGSYFKFGLIVGGLNMFVLWIIFMINDSLIKGGFPSFMSDTIFRLLLLPIIVILIFKIILVDLIHAEKFLKILISNDIARIVELSHSRKKELKLPKIEIVEEIKENKVIKKTKKIKEIKYLRMLELASNKLTKTPELNNLLRSCIYLNYLNLSHNELNKVPEGINHLKKLKHLNIAYNKISDLKYHEDNDNNNNINNITDENSNKSDYKFKLVTLNLSNNLLKVKQYENFCLGSYENLQRLDFSNKKENNNGNEILELPKNLTENYPIKIINFSNTKIGPGHLTNLNEFLKLCEVLEQIDLSNNHLRKFPDSLNKPNLINLNLSNTKIRSLPENLAFKKTLTHLNLSNNYIDEIDKDHENESHIQSEINLSIHNLSSDDHDPRNQGKSIPILPALEELNLSNNRLIELPKSIEKFKNLKIFLFENNLIVEDIEQGLKNNINNNNNLTAEDKGQRLTDNISNISNLTKLTRLEVLDLSGNDSLSNHLLLNGEKGFFSHFDELSSVFLRNIGLEEFPASLVNLTNLNLLDLKYNNIQLRLLDTRIWEFLSQVQILNLGSNKLEYDELDQIWTNIDPTDIGYRNYMKYVSSNILDREGSKKFIINKKIKLEFKNRLKEISVLLTIVGALLLVLYSTHIIFDNIFGFVISISAVLTILFYRKGIRFSGDPNAWRFLNDIIFNILLLFIVIFLITFQDIWEFVTVVGFGLLLMVYDILLESFGYHGNRWKPKGGHIVPYLKIPWEMVLSFFVIGTAGYYLFSIPNKIGISDTLGAFLFRLIFVVGGIIWGTNMDWGSPRTIWQPINKWNVWTTRGIWGYGALFGLTLYYWANPITTPPKQIFIRNIPFFLDDHMVISLLLMVIFMIIGFIRYNDLKDNNNLKKLFSVFLPMGLVSFIYLIGGGLQDIFVPWMIGTFVIIQSIFVLVILNNSFFGKSEKNLKDKIKLILKILSKLDFETLKLLIAVVLPGIIFIIGAILLTF